MNEESLLFFSYIRGFTNLTKIQDTFFFKYTNSCNNQIFLNISFIKENSWLTKVLS